jgi:hypothetical protein
MLCRYLKLGEGAGVRLSYSATPADKFDGAGIQDNVVGVVHVGFLLLEPGVDLS